MKKLLISAGALTALAFTSAPAVAQPVPATTDATATARIYTPLTLTSSRNLDLGTIVLSGVGPYTDTVGHDATYTFACGANVTCSGANQTAQYDVTGTQGATVNIDVAATLDLVNQTQVSPNLVMTVYAPASVPLDVNGEATFDIGGSIDVSDTTAEGVYEGTFAVSAEYP